MPHKSKHIYPLISLFSLFLLTNGCSQEKTIKFTDLKGTWINSMNDYFEIQDTSSKFGNSNYVGNIVNAADIYLQLYGDTLSYQNRYYSSETNFEKLYVERYDFKILSLSDTFLIVKPISEHSIKLFEHRDTIKLIKQKYAVDTSIHFEKIKFHTTHCYGHCPVYHLEIDSSGNVRLHKQRVYKEIKKREFVVDSASIGYYQGKLDQNTLGELVSSIQTCNLNTLEFDGADCCDGSIETIIIYYNGKRKFLQSMFPPRMASKLILKLLEICETKDLKKIDEKFQIEK